MRIIQLIDTLDRGGAERMAVNYANALAKEIDFSALVVTRKEGDLKKIIDKKTKYLFLKRKTTVDFKAIFRLRNYIIENKIQIIQAHSSSYFFAVMLKMVYPKIEIIWHDHFGGRSLQSTFKNVPLKMSSLFFKSVIVVNPNMQIWLKKILFLKNIKFFPNFTSRIQNPKKSTELKGDEHKRIVLVANLKHPKNHLKLMEAFQMAKISKQGWSLHLIGKDFNDLYSEKIKDFISAGNLEKSIYLYGSCDDIENILEQAKIGVLSSTFEGFPVTLLEYGLSKVAVLSTNVGYCSTLIQHKQNGLLFDPLNVLKMASELDFLASDENLRKKLAEHFYRDIFENYSEKAIITSYLRWIEFDEN